MKSYIKWLMLLMILVSFTGIKGQQNFKAYFGAELGWYNPSLEYWNNAGDASSEFHGALMFGFNLKAEPLEYLFVKGGARYWNSGITQGNETIDISVIPFYFDAGLYLDFAKFGYVTPFISGGIAYNFINMSYERETVVLYEDDQSGTDYTFNGALGLNIQVNNDWAIEVAYSQVFGEYTQKFGTYSDTVLEEKVKLGGPMLRMTLNYSVW